ncbi:hypothetical protein ACFOZ0_31160 [Streptomyces yaanensis]|uniref:Secreted protein n=1 Tax=Streptomyces yaanensis TaxID=1142239 RepID=A0ABV7SQT4_9ACTN|nr:hypothetical protein [Streptomyces sp. CGMCC 4.7035]WNC01935.1 hypothetical protein Q2K21_29885 [Streptomyces sp. CGMCC 4.7035]
MKSLKAVAVVAGSLVVAGAAAPAFASDASNITPTSLNGGLATLAAQRTLDVRPLQHQSDTLDTENKDSLLGTAKTTATTLNRNGGPTRLLGGLPLRS